MNSGPLFQTLCITKRDKVNKTKPILIGIFLLLIFPPATLGEIYKYVNEKGVTVFSNKIGTVPKDQKLEVKKYVESTEQTNFNSDLSEDDLRFIEQLKTFNLIDEDADIENVTHEDLELLRSYFQNEDRRIFIHLKDMGLIPEKFPAEYVSDEQWEKFKWYIGRGIPFKSIGSPPDPRFSSPEETWELYKNSLKLGNFDTALQCLTQSRAKQEAKVMGLLGKDQMREIAEAMQPIQKITQDEETAKYRIRRTEEVNGELVDITYYVYFVNLLGNWKINQY